LQPAQDAGTRKKHLENAWAKFERAELDLEIFDRLFAEEPLAFGAEVRGNDVLPLLAGDLRPEMVEAPDPKIYRMMVEALAVDPADCVYLDDLGVNLKPARDMGMATIKVRDAKQALAEIEAATGLPLQ
jgi:putative hydrolase of the HAD superfamily